jgi:RNA polymerase sigma factor (TIGR02999 family)
LILVFDSLSDLTQLLENVQNGDTQAAHDLLPLVYEELRGLARGRLSQEAPGQTLQPTALVHEAWLKVTGSNRQQWRDRTHFYAAAAEAMRRILIDRARKKAAIKRGAAVEIIELTELNEPYFELQAPAEEILAVNEALTQLAGLEPLTARIVEMRYFIGMTVPDIADTLELSVSTVERHWTYARTWLKTAIRQAL